MRKPRSYAEVFNDLDGEVVNVFQVLRDPQSAAVLERSIRLTPFGRADFELAYEPTDHPIERARRTIVRSFMGFGSASQYARHATGFRANGNRNGNHPAEDWANWPDQVPAFVERLRGVVIEERDALDCIAQHDRADTLHYVDPPYVLTTRGTARGVRQKYSREMTDEDHRRLAELLHRVEGFVVLSGYASRLYDELYDGWEQNTRRATADGNVMRTEVVWLNPACSRALSHQAGPVLFPRAERA
jgi:DNA adenine methylase